MGDICKVCGCTDDNACVTEEGPCHWVMKRLCSACYIELPPGENCFKGDVGLIIPKECEACGCIIEETASEPGKPPGVTKKWYTCKHGRFDSPEVSPGGHQWFAWRGIQRPNKTVAEARRSCQEWKLHPRWQPSV